MVAVHPDGWRAVDGRFKDVQLLLRSNEVLYLELHILMMGMRLLALTQLMISIVLEKKKIIILSQELKVRIKLLLTLN
jgi:hypothetical protein